MFSIDDFAKLQFLQGRWKGTNPDGKEFTEEYQRPEPGVLQSHRRDGAQSAAAQAGARITLEDGEILSRWGEQTWRAAEIHADGATFTPVNAPSTFVWRLVDDATLEATQRWNADGREQEHTVRLVRADV
ncbi:hypothetical protein [Pseudoduganella armeniaca]|uniref:DUF1579 domain-containing protein n=1 Tax=Pseudoduganella armeniaca TaxID=2072590 RepID=A0A2R4CF95_9BURK|nr:hypothetical protein [Pseudoduganella armeniaca]AVR98311.1 hypothetical protein C9I28_23715 [Pseudoduganella armeniaca]